MDNSEIIERLAIEVMGWRKDNDYGDEPEDYWTDGFISHGRVEDGWNPLTDWNHWRQIEQKLTDGSMENIELWAKSLGDKYSLYEYMEADLPTRCSALLAALDSLKQS